MRFLFKPFDYEILNNEQKSLQLRMRRSFSSFFISLGDRALKVNP